MKDFKDILKGRLAQNRLNNQSIGALALAIVKKHIQDPDAVGGYLKQHVLFVRLSAHEDKAARYMKKSMILSEINSSLAQLGYHQHIKEMKLARR